MGRGREQDRHRPALGNPTQERLAHDPAAFITAAMSRLRSSRLPKPNDRSDRPVPTLVERDHPCNPVELLKPSEMRQLPRPVEVRDESRHEHEIDRTIAKYLIGDVEPVSTLRVSDVRTGHRPPPRRHPRVVPNIQPLPGCPPVQSSHRQTRERRGIRSEPTDQLPAVSPSPCPHLPARGACRRDSRIRASPRPEVVVYHSSQCRRSAAGRRLAGLKSVPSVWAIGNSPAWL